jgi:benzil reductase ((S)-benzoin forming)
MNYYYLTGTSRGLGKALAEHLLQIAPDNLVIGISRTQVISHKNYTHFSLDLGDPSQVKDFHFPPHHDAKRLVLINNAGIVGLIKPAGKLQAEAIIRNYTTNLVSPTILINSFIEAYRGWNSPKLIINISSGAGKNPIDGWGPYCASKAGIDMFSRVVDEEQKLNQDFPFRIMSVAPGVIDTQMQEDIRNAAPEDFSRLSHFINYKIEDQLAHPDIVARKYAHILMHPEKFPEVLFSVKDIPEQN